MIRKIIIAPITVLGLFVQGFIDDMNDLKIKLNRFEVNFRKFEEWCEARKQKAKEFRGVKP